MVHADDNGLVLPPLVAPTQLVIVPVAQHKPGVLLRCESLLKELEGAGVRVQLDASDKHAGWKFAEHEMRGVPLRLELGPKDIESGQAVVVRRHTAQKHVVPLAGIAGTVPQLLEQVQAEMLCAATEHLHANTHQAQSFHELSCLSKEVVPGFIKAMWCGSQACELRAKEELAVTARCLPFLQEHVCGECVVCGAPAQHMVVWGKAY
jgi:prolyl-tRNA synthetase